MKKRVLTAFLTAVLCLAALGGCGKPGSAAYAWALLDTERYYGGLFGNGEIISVYVEIGEEDWADLRAHASDEKYYPADITVNGTELKNVGFRTKGFSSLTAVAGSDSDRYGFRIKTDKYVKGQTLNGLDMFVLNGSFSDASYMREYLTYAACEYLGMITPILSYANLYVNGELFGFYIMIEAYDDSFVSRNTGDGDAVLYKADEENCTLTTSDPLTGYEVKVGEDGDLSHIRELVEALDGTADGRTAGIEAVLDVDSALKAWAVNTVLGNYDSYSGSKAHNYYLLWSDGKFSYIGWDYNMSVGGFSEDNGASVTSDVASAVYNVDPAARPLISKLLSVDEYYERYIGYVNALCGYFSDIEGMVGWLSGQISEYVKNDPSAFYTYDQFVENTTRTDTDLSKTAGGMPQFPGGSDGGFGGGFPGGFSGGMMPGQGGFPDSGSMPDGSGGRMMPGQGGFPGSGSMPDGSGGMPQFPGGSDGGGFPEGGMMPGMGGFMMNSVTCSVVDYISQRIENIRAQLDK